MPELSAPAVKITLPFAAARLLELAVCLMCPLSKVFLLVLPLVELLVWLELVFTASWISILPSVVARAISP
jgi:hypothetical protein